MMQTCAFSLPSPLGPSAETHKRLLHLVNCERNTPLSMGDRTNFVRRGSSFIEVYETEISFSAPLEFVGSFKAAATVAR